MQCSRCGAQCAPAAKFCSECGTTVGRACAACGEINPLSGRFCAGCGTALTGGRERRQLSVLFCDIVNSVGWSQALDPEDWLRVLSDYQQCVSRCIRDHNGYVTRYVGDAVSGVFGYPLASERYAENAVRAARAIVDQVPRPRAPGGAGGGSSLQVRLAIATGEVVVGEITRETAIEQESVIGQTPNLAARLQALAPADAILIDGQTRALLGDVFELEDFGRQRLKGLASSTQVWRVIAAAHHESLFRAERGRSLTPLVGRADVLRRLQAHWRRAATGSGQVVLLGGEPGMGKSRLAARLVEIAGEDGTYLLYQCSPMHTSSAFYPVAAQLRYLAGITHRDSAAECFDKLHSVVAGTPSERVEAQHWLSRLIGAQAADGAVTEATPDPAAQRRHTLEACRAQLRLRAERKPLLIVFEDAQWSDPTSLELLDLLVDDVRTLPILLLITHRPDFRRAWSGLGHVSRETLTSLPATEIRAMVTSLLGDDLPASVSDQLVERSDGVPLFVEEMSAAILERAHEAKPGPAPTMSIPPTLRGSLLTRLDGLGEARALAQQASVLGREFAYDVLAAITQLAEHTLQALLGQLVDSGLVYVRGRPPQATYAFKHALVRDAAYTTLLKRERKHWHQRVAEALEARFPELASRQPELLARHFTLAGDVPRAVEHWLLAGRRAAARSENDEAVANLTAGLRLQRRLPPSEENRRRELELLVARGPALINARGPATRAVRRNYDRASKLCDLIEESELHFATYWGSLRIEESYANKLKRVENLVRLAERLGDPGYVLQAHHREWATLFHLARHRECMRHIELGLELYASGDYRDHGLRFAGHDPKVCAHGEAGLCLWLLGETERAVRHSTRGLDWARELEHAGSAVHALDFASMLHRYRRDAAALESQAADMLRVGERNHLVEYVSKARIFLAWARAQRGEVDAALDTLWRELDTQRATNTLEDIPVFIETYAEVLGLAGREAQGIAVIADVFDIADANDIVYWHAELHRRHGELLRSGDPAGAERCFEKALDVARTQQASGLELRAAFSLARSWQARGENQRACELLHRVLDGLSPAQQSPEAQWARETLRQWQ